MGKKQARVAHIIEKADLHGGPGYSLLSFLEHLSPEQYESFTISLSQGELTKVLASYCTEVCQLPKATISKFNPLPFLVATMRACHFFLTRKIDIAHFQFHTYRDPLLLAAKLCKVKSILHIRGPAYNFEKSWFNLADAFIFNSAFTQSLANLSPDLLAKSSVIHNAIEPNSFSQRTFSESELSQKFDIPRTTRVIAYVARIHPSKCIEHFIEVANLLKNYQNISFFIIGHRQDLYYYKKLDALVRERELTGRVRFLDHQPDISSLYPRFTCLVHTAEQEPFGRTIIEAQASGVPVCSFSSGALPEIIESGVTGELVEARDIDALAIAVRKILDNPKHAELLALNAKARVEKSFNAREHTEKITSVYNLLLGD